jgi:cyclopropane fatty-acyl-phospholipid synthase-like methyltransferase
MNLVLDFSEQIKAAQKTYSGKKRSELKENDFLFPENRSFPIVSPQDVRDAISNFGRMKSTMSYDTFIKKLYNFAKKKGKAFIDAIPESTKKEHKLA